MSVTVFEFFFRSTRAQRIASDLLIKLWNISHVGYHFKNF